MDDLDKKLAELQEIMKQMTTGEKLLRLDNFLCGAVKHFFPENTPPVTLLIGNPDNPKTVCRGGNMDDKSADDIILLLAEVIKADRDDD